MLLFITLVYTSQMPKGTSGNISGKNDKHLTPKQIQFAREVVYNDGSKTRTECAIAAGYGEAGAAVRASELMNPQKYPLVVRYIQGLQAELDKKYEVTFSRHVRELAKIRDQAIDKGNLTAAVSAEVQRGRAAGLYVERKEIRKGSIDDMSREDVLKQLKELGLTGEFKKEGNNTVLSVEEKSDGKRIKDITPVETKGEQKQEEV